MISSFGKWRLGFEIEPDKGLLWTIVGVNEMETPDNSNEHHASRLIVDYKSEYAVVVTRHRIVYGSLKITSCQATFSS